MAMTLKLCSNDIQINMEMYPPSSMCVPNMVMEKMTSSGETWHQSNKVSRSCKWGHDQMTHSWMKCIVMADMYPQWSVCGPNMVSLASLYGHGENYIITKFIEHTWLTCTNHDQCVDPVWWA
jgi:hypothetical protein